MQNSKIGPANEFITCTYPQPILQKGNQVNVKQRFDLQGQQIIKGKKKHCIQFKTEIQKVYMVENWKEYNLDPESVPQVEKCCTLF